MTLHQAAADGFERQADAYQRSRPSYHPDLVARFVEHFGDGRVLDLGAGTGKFTEQLVAAGVVPVAVEPVDAMRDQLCTRLEVVDARAGSAEDIPVADESVDTVVVAQAFHWFRHGPALDEIVRVLKPGGALVTVWNVRDHDDPLVRSYSEIINRHAADTPRHHTMDWRRAIDGHGRFELVDDFAIANPWATDVDGVIGRALSTSFIGALDVTAQAQVERDLRQVAAAYGPQISYAYRGELQAWRLRH